MLPGFIKYDGSMTFPHSPKDVRDMVVKELRYMVNDSFVIAIFTFQCRTNMVHSYSFNGTDVRSLWI